MLYQGVIQAPSSFGWHYAPVPNLHKSDMQLSLFQLLTIKSVHDTLTCPTCVTLSVTGN